MSGHLRLCLVSLFLAGLATSPASSNPFESLFNPAPAEATAPAATPAPAPADEGCLPQPGKSTADGQHWVYRYDGHRKCWFQAAEGTAAARKPVHHAVRPRVAASNEGDESAPPRRKAVEEARAELSSSAPTEATQPTPPAPELKVADAAPVPAAGAAPPVPSAPVIAGSVTDQPRPDQSKPDQSKPDQSKPDQSKPDQPMPRQVDVEALLADAPAASDDVASAPPATPVAVSPANTHSGRDRTTTWLGMLLMALGLVSLLSSSRTLRALLTVRFRNPDRSSWPSSTTAEPVFPEEPDYVATRIAAENDEERNWDTAPLEQDTGVEHEQHGRWGGHRPKARRPLLATGQATGR